MRLTISKTILTYVSSAFFTLALSYAAPSHAQPADVRVLVDVSGSMKQADPNAVRGPATALLAALLPDNSLGGIWLFGSDVRPLVPYGPVSSRWDTLGAPIESSIGSTDRFTHIESALRTGVETGGTDLAACHVILITDGLVDVQGGRDASQASRDRILKAVVPNAQSRRCRIHTIALSEDADLPLLRQIALQTDGLFTLIDQPGDLIPVMLDALELALRSQQLPVRDGQIQIDADIEQLRFIRLGNEPVVALTGPQGPISRDTQSDALDWYKGRGYEALIWNRPKPGVYRLNAPLGPNDRILIDSPVRLELTELPPTIAANQSLGLAAQIIGSNGAKSDPTREYRVAFGALADPIRINGSDLQTQIDSPAPGRTLLTLQSFDATHTRQVQRMFEVLDARPEMEIANNTAQGVGTVGSSIQADSSQTNSTAGAQSDLTGQAEKAVSELLPEDLKTWPLWQLAAIALAGLAMVALIVGLFIRPKHPKLPEE